jgi:hypothetical protein
VDQLEQRIRSHVVAQIGTLDGAPGDSEPLRDLLLAYRTWQARQIPARPGEVHRSAELNASATAVAYRAELDTLVEMIELGRDLTSRLSRGAQKIKRRDRMLADWGIAHLHLTPQGGPDFVFAAFHENDAYLIGIYPHNSWALREVAEIAVRTWPAAQIFQPLNLVVGLAQSVSGEDRAQLRAAGVSASMVEVDGRVYVSEAIGQTLAGTNIIDVMHVNQIMHTLRDLRENLRPRLKAYRDEAERQFGRRPGRFRSALQNGSFGVLGNGIFIPIGSLG